MANCDMCGKKLGFLDGVSLEQTYNRKLYSITICEKCAIIYEQACNGDKKAISDFTTFINNPKNEKLKAFIAAKEQYKKEKQEQKEREERAAQEKERQSREKSADEYAMYVAQLKQSGADGYYEYKVIKLMDNVAAGCLDANLMMNTLNQMGLEGWRLVNAYSNELGKNALALGGFGVNATADEHILIFERFQKI